ncbi:hypothetical protein NM688_g2980 [Phlebia brevispora]|uniref:Uncharacterized protein n=1 Tax=Phlebia brevispora TaxID=194682 RepID=A0ACC1T7F6_9APHY|nr:hypothetical protein NM688_g2980 [Phlebia brevispora]
MSTPGLTPAAVAVYESELTFMYCTFGALGLAAYEYMITLEHEYEFVWRRKWTPATWLFVTNRYILLTSIALQAMRVSAQVRLPDSKHEFGELILFFQTCYNSSLETFLFFLATVPIIIATLFSALRVFALLERAYLTATCVLLLGLVPVATVFYNSIMLVVTLWYMLMILYWDRHASQPLRFLHRNSSVNLAALLAAIASELIAVVATWLKTYSHVRQAAALGIKAGFGATLIQNGTLYFVVILVIYILPLVTIFIPSNSGIDNVTDMLTAIIPNLVVSRFLINLRQVDSPTCNDVSRFSNFSAPNFRVPSLPDIIGNLGERLADGEEAFADDEQDADCEGCCEKRSSELPNSGEEEGMLSGTTPTGEIEEV